MKNKILYIIIILLLVIISVEGYLIFISQDKEKESKKENNNQNNLEVKKNDSIKLITTKKDDNSIIQEYEIILNGKKNNKLVRCSIENETGEEYSLICQFNKIIIYENTTNESNKEEMLNIDFIKNKISEDNFKIIKDRNDKSYLAIEKVHNNYNYEGSIYLNIFNDNYDLISDEDFAIYLGGQDLILENDSSPWYQDAFNLKKYIEKDLEKYNSRIKINNKKIYYLYFNYDAANETENYSGYLEEREYTINNNKLEYRINKKYKVIKALGTV